jgi:hypothetical protein
MSTKHTIENSILVVLSEQQEHMDTSISVSHSNQKHMRVCFCACSERERDDQQFFLPPHQLGLPAPGHRVVPGRLPRETPPSGSRAGVLGLMAICTQMTVRFAATAAVARFRRLQLVVRSTVSCVAPQRAAADFCE